MFRFGFLGRIVVALLLIGLLVGGGVTLYRAGFAQGYQTGALSVQAGGNPATPQTPFSGGVPPYYYYYWPHYGFPGFFPPFGLFFGIGLFLLFLFLIGGLFRGFGWRGRHGYYGYGPGPGWGPHPHDRGPGETPEEGNPPEQPPSEK